MTLAGVVGASEEGAEGDEDSDAGKAADEAEGAEPEPDTEPDS